ncbi:hypothetical protein BC828DRAFT_118949 [Blastocladiella britannica]|nr:hypothetical protein BC828DRAFT_118949 [Blastocladiella britannica]
MSVRAPLLPRTYGVTSTILIGGLAEREIWKKNQEFAQHLPLNTCGTTLYGDTSARSRPSTRATCSRESAACARPQLRESSAATSHRRRRCRSLAGGGHASIAQAREPQQGGVPWQVSRDYIRRLNEPAGVPWWSVDDRHLPLPRARQSVPAGARERVPDLTPVPDVHGTSDAPAHEGDHQAAAPAQPQPPHCRRRIEGIPDSSPPFFALPKRTWPSQMVES